MTTTPSSGKGIRAGDGRELSETRWSKTRAGQKTRAGHRHGAAAGAADGALGLGRPAASGSRWRRNAARQDFSRSAEARRVIGRAAVARERLATEASRTSTAANTAPARTAVARAVRA